MTTALIVDDSRLARTVLRKSLIENGLAVDETPSAEAAIEYLRSSRPDVIFLDHLMPGMDGFEALRAIKANPRTATIPVMMYTSQDGQMYMSQARALGAVDVLPKTLEPADIGRVLCTHHLAGDSATNTSVEQVVRDAKEAARGLAETARIIHEEERAELVRSMIREHREILVDEIRKHLARMKDEALIMAPPTTGRPRATASSAFGQRLAAATMAMTIVAAVGFGALYIHTARLLSKATLQPPTSSMGPDFAVDARDVASRPALPNEALSSASSEIAAQAEAKVQHYAFGAIPLDDDRAVEYGSILASLKDAGFTGDVQIEIHEGRFCLNYTSDGRFELAPSDQPAIFCDRIGTAAETVLSTQQTVVFSNMVGVASRDGQLRIEAVFLGPALPIVDYPVLDYGITAGEWNAVAASNQRVALRLARGESDAGSSRTADMTQRDDLDRTMAQLVR